MTQSCSLHCLCIAWSHHSQWR